MKPSRLINFNIVSYQFSYPIIAFVGRSVNKISMYLSLTRLFQPLILLPPSLLGFVQLRSTVFLPTLSTLGIPGGVALAANIRVDTTDNIYHTLLSIF